MNCEEFELEGLDGSGGAARAHADSCPRCAALLERWQSARADLRVLAGETRGALAPARVEMRLRQEFRAARWPQVSRKSVVAAVWALAAVAGIAAAVSWETWKSVPNGDLAHSGAPATATAPAQKPLEKTTPAIPPEVETPAATQQAKRGGGAARSFQVATRAPEPFSLLPGILPEDAQQTDLVTVRMRRAALGALGLPVNEERANDWIQVDMLVGYDGQPRAVRLDKSAAQDAAEW